MRCEQLWKNSGAARDGGVSGRFVHIRGQWSADRVSSTIECKAAWRAVLARWAWIAMVRKGRHSIGRSEIWERIRSVDGGEPSCGVRMSEGSGSSSPRRSEMQRTLRSGIPLLQQIEAAWASSIEQMAAPVASAQACFCLRVVSARSTVATGTECLCMNDFLSWFTVGSVLFLPIAISPIRH